MAAVNSRGGGRRRRTMNEINMVPFIDVMLVLLIIFMVSAPLITTGLVDLPSVGKITIAVLLRNLVVRGRPAARARARDSGLTTARRGNSASSPTVPGPAAPSARPSRRRGARPLPTAEGGRVSSVCRSETGTVDRCIVGQEERERTRKNKKEKRKK